MLRKSNRLKFHIRYSIFRGKGQSLFEVILALAISAIILTGIVSLSSTSINTSTVSNNKSQANRYAGEAMEYVRKEKAFLGWNSFITTIGTGSWCLKTLDFTVAPHAPCGASDYLQDPPGKNTVFKRELTLETITSDYVTFRIVVSWVDEKGTHETRSVSTVSNW